MINFSYPFNMFAMIKYFFFPMCFFIIQCSIGQCTLTIKQEGPKNGFIIPEYQDVKPRRVNDSTTAYIFNIAEPDYLYILLDTSTKTNWNYNWNTRIWIDPKIKHRELIINYSTKTVKINDIIKWNKNEDRYVNNIQAWDSITKLTVKLDTKEKYAEELNIVIPYMEQHPDSYLSLWFFGHSHALYIESNDKKLALFDKLSPALSIYPEYHQMQADLSGARKYPNVGDTFKEFTLTDVRGKVFNSKSVKNKWILLHFWSNGCGPCVKEMDDMVKYYKTLDTSKIAFISVALDDNRDKWKKAPTTQKIKWASLWEKDNFYGDLCLNYNVYSMPFFVLFNNEKKLVIIQDGADAIEANIKVYVNKIK